MGLKTLLLLIFSFELEIRCSHRISLIICMQQMWIGDRRREREEREERGERERKRARQRGGRGRERGE